MPLTMTVTPFTWRYQQVAAQAITDRVASWSYGALLDSQKSSKLERGMFLTSRDSQTDRGEWPLPVDLGHRVAQGFVGESHEAAIGLAQLENKENRARDR